MSSSAQPSSELGAAGAALVGRTVAGKYEILELLGEGAMGRVFRARQLPLGKPVAVKVLHAHLSGQPRVAKRFEREALAASRLAHPSSVQILDFGADGDTHFLAMELLDGEDLQTILDHDAPLSPTRIVDILVPVLRALEEAHRAGIIHRDLKPENVVVIGDRSGREHVKVCDFGIAKILDEQEGPSITVDGYVCGTPHFMAPEVARGDTIDHRSDLYAAGVVLYKMMTGVVPFDGETTLGVLTKHLTESPPSPREKRPELAIPEGLEQLCMRALAKERDERFQTAAEMADALESVVKALGPLADVRFGLGRAEDSWTADRRSSAAFRVTLPPQPKRPSRAPWIVAIAITGVASAGAALWLRPSDPPRVASVETAPTVIERVVYQPAVTPPTPAPAPIISVAEEAPTTPRPRARARLAAPPAPQPIVSEPASPTDLAFDEGRRRFLANDVRGAITSYEEAARLSPDSAAVHKQLGRAYMRSGDVPRSVAAYRRYLVLAPDAPDRSVVERIVGGP